MSSPSEISDLMNRITDDVRTIISGEIALVKAELKPAVRRVGVGAGMFGLAAYFIICAVIVIWFLVAAGFAWLFASVTPLSGWASAFFGILIAFVLLLVAAVVAALTGGKSFSKIKGPEKAPEALHETITSVITAIGEGNERVAAELHPEPHGDDTNNPVTSSAPASAPAAVPFAPVGGTSHPGM